MQYIDARTVVTVKWTCTCEGSVRNVAWRSAKLWECWQNVSAPSVLPTLLINVDKTFSKVSPWKKKLHSSFFMQNSHAYWYTLPCLTGLLTEVQCKSKRLRKNFKQKSSFLCNIKLEDEGLNSKRVSSTTRSGKVRYFSVSNISFSHLFLPQVTATWLVYFFKRSRRRWNLLQGNTSFLTTS